MTYKTIVEQGMILDKKPKYTVEDFEALVRKGTDKKTARFICLCSAVYHNTEFSEVFNSIEFRNECGIK